MKKKEYLLSVTEVKNIFKQQSKEALIELLVDCYKTMPQLKEYITAQYANNDTIEQIFENYKNKVHDVFFPQRIGAQLKLNEARKAVSDFKKLCSDEKLVIDLILYYVEMGVEFTDTYGDIYESFYNSIESMYEAVVKAINKQKTSDIFHTFSDRLKAVVDNTSGMGWGFHDDLSSIYSEIKWLDLENIDYDESELEKIKEYICDRLEKRDSLPDFDKEVGFFKMISDIIEADEVFLAKMDATGKGFSNDDEHDFIAEKTGYSVRFIELVLWQRCCYEMEDERWKFDAGECSNCGSSELYLREVSGVDFADQVICKRCGTEYIR